MSKQPDGMNLGGEADPAMNSLPLDFIYERKKQTSI